MDGKLNVNLRTEDRTHIVLGRSYYVVCYLLSCFDVSLQAAEQKVTLNYQLIPTIHSSQIYEEHYLLTPLTVKITGIEIYLSLMCLL